MRFFFCKNNDKNFLLLFSISKGSGDWNTVWKREFSVKIDYCIQINTACSLVSVKSLKKNAKKDIIKIKRFSERTFKVR